METVLPWRDLTDRLKIEDIEDIHTEFLMWTQKMSIDVLIFETGRQLMKELQEEIVVEAVEVSAMNMVVNGHS